MHGLLLAVCCTVTIHVHTPSGAPLAGAHIVMHGQRTYASSTNASGDASLTAQGGTYQVDTTARGYTGVSIDLFLRDTAVMDVTLQPLDAPTLRTIGTVTVDGRLTPIRGAIPSVTVSRADMDRLGDDRVIDSLMALPGATFTRPDGGSAAAISVVSLRGPDPSESLLALDGQLLNDGNTSDLDLSRFPSRRFRRSTSARGLVLRTPTGAIPSAVRSISSRCNPRWRRISVFRSQAALLGKANSGSTRPERRIAWDMRLRSITNTWEATRMNDSTLFDRRSDLPAVQHAARFIGRVASGVGKHDLDLLAKCEHHGARTSSKRCSRRKLIDQWDRSVESAKPDVR